VAEVQIRRGRIEPDLDSERTARRRRALELSLEFAGADDIHAAFGEVRQLFFDGHRRMSLSQQPGRSGRALNKNHNVVIIAA
jgi:hypothetical protein